MTSIWILRLTFVLTLVAVLGVGFLGGRIIMGFVSGLLLLIGSFLVAFGFWGADFAFSVRLGELDQSKQDGQVKGARGMVYVPFERNYTPTEWWNLNWYFISIGVLCAVTGAFYLAVTLLR